jgi:hypothetical protein
MNWQLLAGLLTAVGSLGWLVALLTFRSQNRKTLAEADETVQRLNRVIFDQMVDLLRITKAELLETRKLLDDCEARCRDGGG